AEQLPANDQYIRYVKIQSTLLTRFHKRPIYLRAGVILPRDYGAENRRWPLRIHIGGYGTRYTSVQGLIAAGGGIPRKWGAAGEPRGYICSLGAGGAIRAPV